jgi:hypothetical protein
VARTISFVGNEKIGLKLRVYKTYKKEKDAKTIA